MGQVEITHVAVVATDLQQSLEWYTELFGSDNIVQVPNMQLGKNEAVWLQIGRLGLHLAQWPEQYATGINHFGIGVTDPDLFHSIYQKAMARGWLDSRLGSNIYEIPSGEVQMFLLDPSKNLVEVDFPDASLLDRDIIKNLPRVVDVYEHQPDRAAEGKLFGGI
jgi:catechol 2,3-dioxygenase-like lactoylglutathione lyase family enzyme